MLKLEQQGKGVGIPNIRNKKRTRILLEGMNNISRSQSVESVVKEGVKTVKLILDADVGDLILINKQTGKLNESAFHAANNNNASEWSWNIQKEIARWVLKSEKLYCTNGSYSAATKKLYQGAQSSFKNVLCLPLKADNKSVGVIQAANRKERATFKEEDIADLELFAQYLAFAIQARERQEEVESQLEERDLFMTEIHHRLKNNLSTVTSLIEMDLPKITDQESISILEQTCSRIKSITEVHNLLYQVGNSDTVDLATYFRKLSGQIAETLSKNFQTVSISIQGDSVEIDSERTMTCGLILNELILNAYKHAFDSVEKGKIAISISENEDHIIRITVSDNGKGIGNNFSLDQDESMGCWVIKALADRLDASIDISSKEGTRYALAFTR